MTATANIFSRRMTLLSRVSLTSAELQNGMRTISIGEFVSPEFQSQCNDVISRIRDLCPDYETKLRNKQKVTELKRQLPAGVISGVLSDGIGADAIVERNSCIAIDIDESDNRTITDWTAAKWAISCLPYISYCGLSVSGRGVWAIIPIANSNEHTEHFKAIADDLAHTSLNVLQWDDKEVTRWQGIIVDDAPSNISSKRFLSYDDEAYYNPCAEIYTRTLEPTSVQPVQVMTQQKSIFHSYRPERFNMRLWLNNHGIQYSEREREGGVQYEVRCPWESLHTSGENKRESCVFVDAQGRPGYKCMHSHCADKSWRDFREYYDNKPRHRWGTLVIR